MLLIKHIWKYINWKIIPVKNGIFLVLEGAAFVERHFVLKDNWRDTKLKFKVLSNLYFPQDLLSPIQKIIIKNKKVTKVNCLDINSNSIHIWNWCMKNKVTTNVTFVVKTFAYTAINRVQKVHILNLENNPQKRGRPLVIQCKQAPNWYSIQYFD